MKYDVYGIGNPIIDLTIKVTDSDIESLGLDKGTMHLIDENRRSEILNFLKDKEVQSFPAGSCPNTIMGLSSLGSNSIINGRIGNGNLSKQYINEIEGINVISRLKSSEGVTGTSIILITPDSQRTMNTFLGNCRKFSKEDIDIEAIKESKFLYFTGYMWDTDSQKEACNYAMKIAKENGVKFVFNLADPNLVLRNKDELFNFILDKVDFLISNEEEIIALMGEDYESAIKDLENKITGIVVTMGENGSKIKHKGSTHLVDSFKVSAVDSTGAGDMYTSGFLYGMSLGIPVENAAKIGSYFASKIVSQLGTKINDETINDVKEFIEKLK
ncbi:adenosine kinase [archaeon]|jgi:sugar/nucleoside kinase (ribokinase family)|nr:adenosine kinase [archaeon]MBT4647651.1 adenosine kinase [archaeon]MBT6822234.1 adenosine kinase [archaeon]MBT7391715.1 adenosine kinase [archaeon]